MGMIGASIFIAIIYTTQYAYAVCVNWTTYSKQFASSQQLATMEVNSLWGEIAAFGISNGAQLLYSCLYLLLIYNITLISMEYEWGKFEKGRQRLRCTIVKSERFDESYFLQLPKKILFPIMAYSVIMHWLLGLAILAEENIVDDGFTIYSQYVIVTVPDGVWGSSALLLAMTSCCWWAFTYKREGFIPQMFGSIRTLCASTSELHDFPAEGIHWGDLGTNETGTYRHAGLSGGEIGEIVPNEIYA
ncbi:Nad-binding protein [Neofusicoccum parvum]|nr:Nad-binding protein [Neofusicoccum parvum]